MQSELRLLTVFFPRRGGAFTTAQSEDRAYHVQRKERSGGLSKLCSLVRGHGSRGVPDAWLASPQDSYCTGGGQETGGWASKEKWNHPKPQSSWEMVTLVGGACLHTQQGSPSELWQILNLQDVEAKFLWQRWQRHSKILIQSPGELRPDRGWTKSRTSLSLTFLRRQSPTRGRGLGQIRTRSHPETFEARENWVQLQPRHDPVYVLMASRWWAPYTACPSGERAKPSWGEVTLTSLSIFLYKTSGKQP